MFLILISITCGSLFLQAFVTIIHPRKSYQWANRWLSFFLFVAACAIASPIINDYTAVTRLMELSRFAMTPALYLSVLYFTSPAKKFRRIELLHFIPL